MEGIDLDGMADVYGDLNDFDKRMKNTNGAIGRQQDDDSSEEENHAPVNRQNPVMILQEKNKILLDRLYKSEKQLEEMKGVHDALNSNNDSLKDKKIIELSKRTRALQIQAESLKTKAAKAAEFALDLKKENDKIAAARNESPGLTSQGSSKTVAIDDSPAVSSKKLKENERRITHLRNQNQEQKILLEKATRLLEREIGEVVDIHELSKEESQWKGRSQKIEILKSQVKKLKAQGGGGGYNGDMSQMTDNLSVISENTVFTGKITHAERNLTKLASKKGEDVDKMKYLIEEQKEELAEVKQKYKGAMARRDTVEQQLKTIKTDFGMKMKMLLDKTENDDKLIKMLKQEIGRLEQMKGIKSNLKSDMGGASQQTISEQQKLQRDVKNLTNQVKCLDIELEQKDKKIKDLMLNCIGAPDEASEEKELRIAELEDKCEKLERSLFKAKQDAQDQGQKRFPKKTKDEQERIIQDLTKSNAMLRRKLDDAQQKVIKLENR